MKRVLTFSVVLLITTGLASAQVFGDFTCTADVDSLPTIRAEGLAEFVGDVIVNCTGGTPTPPGEALPRFEFRLLLPANFTSALLDGPYSEALAAIGDPPRELRYAGITGFEAVAGDPPSADNPNVFLGEWDSPNRVVWHNLPIDPPGDGVRTIRLTNIRVNASQLGVTSSTTAQSLDALLSVYRSEDLKFISTDFPTVAEVLRSFEFSVPVTIQCDPEGVCDQDFQLNYKENFRAGFRRRDPSVSFSNPGGSFDAPFEQDPGSASGFGGFVNETIDLPNGRTIGTNQIGRAESGTRLFVKFSDVPNGVTIYVPPFNDNASEDNCARLVESASGPTAVGFDTGKVISNIPKDPFDPAAVWEVCDGNAGPSGYSFTGRVTVPEGVSPGTIHVTGFLGPSDPLDKYLKGIPAFRRNAVNYYVTFDGSSTLNETVLRAYDWTPEIRPGEHALWTLSSGPVANLATGPAKRSAGLTIENAEELPVRFELTSAGYQPQNVILLSPGERRTGLEVSVEADFTPKDPENPATLFWLTAETANDATPMTVTISVESFATLALAPGTYNGAVIVTETATADQTRIPVELVVPEAGPRVSGYGVGNAGSYAANVVSPGEAIVIFGSAFGPDDLVTLQLADGKVATEIGATRVLFDGIPAPMIFTVKGQVSCFVPFGIETQDFTEMVVEYQGKASPPVRLAVLPAAPGLLTATQSGGGIGAILNQNGSFNAQIPERAGNIIQVFGTGGGQTSPPAQDGTVNTGQSSFNLPVQVLIDGREVPFEYAGPAPGLVEGVFQINVRIPPGTQSGLVPLVVVFGGVSSQPGVFVQVR